MTKEKRKRDAVLRRLWKERRGMMEDFRKPRNAKQIAWEMFEETGNVTYYMLYKQLKD